MFEFNRQLIKLINNARTEPKNTARSITTMYKDNYHGTELSAFGKVIDTFEGVDALFNLEEYLCTQEPSHSLVHSKALDQAAQLIAEQKGRQGQTQNQKPRVIYQTVQKFGKTNGKIGQLISLAATTPSEIATYFLIDDGLASRKRRRMLIDPVYRYVGIGQAVHTQYQYITVILMAEILQQNDNYLVQNSRFTEQLKRQSQSYLRGSQSQGMYRGNTIIRQSSVRESQFY